MADALLDDDFYCSGDDIIAQEASVPSDTETVPTKQPTSNIHPDRMIIPTLKRHADSVIVDVPDAPVKKQKKKRAEEPIPVSPEEQLAHILSLYAKHKKPTALETNNITSLTAEHIIDTTHFRGNTQSFIQVLQKSFHSGKGKPRVLILTTSAVRCIDLVRTDLPHLHRIHTVAKLFAKHNKLADHVEMLSKTIMRIAVGTPGRVLDLQKEESVDLLKHCSIVVLDMRRDSKNQNVLTLDDCSKATFDFLDLATEHFLKHGLKLMFKF